MAKKLILPNAKGKLEEREIKKQPPRRFLVGPGQNMYALNTQDGKIYPMAFEFVQLDVSKFNCDFEAEPGFLYSIAKNIEEAKKDFTNQLKKLQKDATKKEIQG